MKRTAIFVSALLLTLSAMSAPVYAQDMNLGGGATGNASTNLGGGPSGNGTNLGGGSQGCGFLLNPLDNECNSDMTLNDLLSKILNVIVQIGVVVLTMMLVYVGFLFVTAQGNPENLSKARSALIWTIIGGFLVLGASVIAEAVKSTVEAL
ncbi:MAG: hypothetical protein KBC38_00130 [Candidatus Pacebacteria bacterium]|nr:hypothetical protein [Candidatus Paceibacterota bacterium]MBP9840410.1 hypothetical protein [Candidatus Paceibacterota bacterium]